MEHYRSVLQEALSMDEKACFAHESKQTDDAINAYNQAAKLYAEAAGILLDVLESSRVSEQADFRKSVNRLIAASREMKEASECLKQVKSIPPKEKNVQDDDEPILFKPSETPNVHFSDIAGLDDAKQRVMDKIIHPLKYPDLYKRFGIKSHGGLMLYGPPGGGKTMMARAVATESGLPFFSVKCSDLVGKYFGEAEKRIRALFAAAHQAHNAVIFLDESEAIACRRGSNSTVMNRLVPELLSQMDGFEQNDDHIIVIFATNRPYDIDPAFLRSGRMAAMCYIPLPDETVRRHLLTKQFSTRPCSDDIDIEALVRDTERFSCADLVGLVDQCAQLPLNRSIARTEEDGDADIKEMITNADIQLARSQVFPSVEDKELERLNKWMTSMKGA